MVISAGGGGGVAGAGGVLAFEWNRTDKSQLVSDGAMDFVAGGGGGSWDVNAVAERGNVLEYTPAGGTAVTEIAMFSPALPHLTDRRDLIIEIEVYDVNFGTGGLFGSFFYGDLDTPLHGFMHLPYGTAEGAATLDNGTPVSSGTSGTRANVFTSQVIRGEKLAGVPPVVSSYSSGFSVTGGVQEPRRSGSTSAIRGVAQDIGNNTSLGATWNNIGADRFGLAIRSSGGNAPPTTVRILNFRVYVL